MTDTRAATIADVARLAGVSRAAVSKVIRDAYGVSPSMRKRVNAAIEQLEYRPRIAARAMRGATFTLGIELPHIGNPFFSKILNGAMAALEDTQYQLIIAPTAIDVDRDGRALQALADRQVDGVVSISPLVPSGRLERIAARIPVVLLGRHDESDAYDTVTGDDAEGTRQVMEHLLGLGHRRIGHITRDERITRPGLGTPHAVRLERYLAHMRRAGYEDDARVVRTAVGGDLPESGADELLDREPRCTAIFAGTDELALRALRAMAERGLSPADVSVVGYDDTDIAGHPAISLTSVDQDGELMGGQAIRLLLERIDGRTGSVHFSVEPRLKARSSTRPTPA